MGRRAGRRGVADDGFAVGKERFPDPLRDWFTARALRSVLGPQAKARRFGRLSRALGVDERLSH